MKKSRLLDSVSTTLLAEDKIVSGKKHLERVEGDAEFSVRGVRFGEELSDPGDKIYVATNSDVAPPGLISSRPYSMEVSGFTPSMFQEPFTYSYATRGDSFTERDWIGQDSYAVKSYMGFNFSETALTESLYIANPFMFSHEGDLFFVSERRERFGDQHVNTVTLYKMVGDIWNTVYKFTEHPIDVWSYDPLVLEGRGVRAGSPSAVSANGQIYISYRSVDRGAGTSRLMVYRGLDEFELISDTLLEDTPSIADNHMYRQRLAYGAGVFMLVSYGIYRNGSRASIRDMRTYVSFDGGYLFKTRDLSYKRVIKESSGRTENLSNYFITGEESGAGIPFYQFNVNFSLAFDEKTASFMLFKGGDGANMTEVENELPSFPTLGSDFLVGLSAYATDPFNWEPVCRYRLNRDNIALPSFSAVNASGDLSLFDKDVPADVDGAFWIQDVCIISNGVEHFFFLSLHSLYYHYNTCLTKFSLVPSSDLPKGFTNKLLAYGQKLHPDLLFVSDPIDPDQTGLVHTGAPCFEKLSETSGQIQWKDIMGCFWRGQMVYTGKLSGGPGVSSWDSRYSLLFDRFFFMAIAGRYSNLTEDIGYQLSYPKLLRDPTGFGFRSETGGQPQLWNAGTKTYTMSPTLGDPNYIYLADSSDFMNLVERASASSWPVFKARFQMRYGQFAATNRMTVFKWECESSVKPDNLISVRMRLDNLGRVSFLNHAGDSSGRVFTLEEGVLYDISIIADISSRYPRLFVSYKESTEMMYSVHEAEVNIAKRGGGPLSRTVAFGIIEVTGASEGVVGFGDLHVSCYSAGYKRQLASKNSAPSERRAYGSMVSAIASRPCTSLKRGLELHDGTVLELSGLGGFGARGRRHVASKVAHGRQLNSVKNLEIPNPSLPYFFGSVYNSSEDLLYRLDNCESFDTIAVIHAAGCYEVEVSYGHYNEEFNVWTSPATTDTFSWPIRKLDVEDGYGRILVTNDKTVSHELKGRWLWVYDHSLGEYTQQSLIIANDEGVLTLEDPVAISSSTEVHIPNISAAFTVSEPYKLCTHVMVSLKGLPSSKKAVSNIEIGTMIDLSQVVTEMTEEYDTLDRTQETDTKYLFNTYNTHVPLYESYDFTLPDVSHQEFDHRAVLGVLLRSKEERSPVVIAMGDDGDVKYGFITSVSHAPTGRDTDISFNLQVSSYINDLQDYQIYPSKMDIIFNTANIVPNIAFTAEAATDVSGGLDFEWDMGDGATYTMNPVTHMYTGSGLYTINLKATDDYGNVVERSKTVYVVQPQISDYLLTASGTGTYTLTLTAKDFSGTTVPDSSMRIRFSGSSGAMPSPLEKTLENGSATFSITSPPTTISLVFSDSEGKRWIKQVSLT